MPEQAFADQITQWSFWRKVLKLDMVVCAVVIVVAAVSISSVMAVMDWVTFKQPVPLRYKLWTMPDKMGPYEVAKWPDKETGEIKPDKKGPAETPQAIIDELGTKDFITWGFTDTNLKLGQPGSYIQLHITYYTGTVDTVPHVVERCVTAGGARATSQDTMTLVLDNPFFIKNSDGLINATTASGKKVHLPTDRFGLRLVHFQDKQQGAFNIGYFFASNGKFVPRAEDVRAIAFDINNKYAYYCKIQIYPRFIKNKEEAAKAIEKFLAHALPEIMHCLPDWREVEAGRYPVKKKSN